VIDQSPYTPPHCRSYQDSAQTMHAWQIHEYSGSEGLVMATGGCSLLRHGRMARGGHGLCKVSLGFAMPYVSTPCGRPAAVFYPLKTPYAVRLCGTPMNYSPAN
jgi:hypothetical protein